MVNLFDIALFASAAPLIQAVYTWPSPKYDALESQLFEGRAPDFLNVAKATAQCQRRNKLAPSSPVAAEWLRLAYHDVATHNIDNGSGGMDASIRFELGRQENIGQGMVETLFQDFPKALTKYTSYADVIAMGVLWGVASCDGPVIPFKGGRVDATSAGPAGVPEPDQTLATHTTKFAKQGFSATEMIQLVACGHTIGGVRSPDFPNLGASGTDPSAPDFDRFAFFDDTDTYDHSVVSKFLDNTTPDVLVTASDTTFRSDQRIFNSDGGAAMTALNSATSFASTCTTVLQKMINIVPTGVSLSDITLLPVKVSWANIIHEDQLLLNVAVRFAVPHDPVDINPAPTKVVKLYWCDKRGSFANCASNSANLATNPDLTFFSSPLSDAMKQSLQLYEFSAPILASQSVSKFWFEADGVKYDNGGTGYVFAQDQVIFLPYLKEDGFDSGGSNYVLIAGVRSELTPSSVKLNANGVVSSTLTPYQTTVQLQFDSARSSAHNVDGYKLYSGTLTHYPDQLTIDSEAQISGVFYRDDFRTVKREIDLGSPRPVSMVSKVTYPGHP